MKICYKCKQEKDISDFYLCKSRPDGHGSLCKTCQTEYFKNYKNTTVYKLSKQRSTYKYDLNNKEKINLRHALYYSKNKEKIKNRVKKYQETHKEKLRKHVKNYNSINKSKISKRRYTRNLKTKYNINLEEYNTLISKQNNSCAICTKIFNKTPCIDHDHQTGKTRGILCRKCNAGLGLFNDDVSILQNAIKYKQFYTF